MRTNAACRGWVVDAELRRASEPIEGVVIPAAKPLCAAKAEPVEIGELSCVFTVLPATALMITDLAGNPVVAVSVGPRRYNRLGVECNRVGQPVRFVLIS